MTPIKAFIEKHPVLTYYALVFAISWGGILMLVAPCIAPSASSREFRTACLRCERAKMWR